VEPADLRSFLRAELPEPMVPSAFVVLDEFPVTASGKLDRRSLPAPEALHGAPAAVPSSDLATPEEAALAGLWREILGIDHVGKDDDFFAVGGDSILLLKLCARARERGLGLAPRDLFAHPVLGELAAALAARRASA
jgi:aryl carrier-like protein